MNFVTRSTDWPRRSASSAGERPAIQAPMPRSSSARRAMASSTRSTGFGSPRHDSVSWIARWATCPFAVDGFHSKSSGIRWFSSHSSTDVNLYFEMYTSWFGARRSVNSSSATRTSVRMSAIRSGSKTTGSEARRNAASVLSWVGVKPSMPLTAATPATSPLIAATVPSAPSPRPNLATSLPTCSCSFTSASSAPEGPPGRRRGPISQRTPERDQGRCNPSRRVGDRTMSI